jgi:hypothetical protein
LDFLNLANLEIFLQAKRTDGTYDVDRPTAEIVSVQRNLLYDHDSASAYPTDGSIVIRFHKLGPSNIGADLFTIVQMKSCGQDACLFTDSSIDTGYTQQVATVVSGAVQVDPDLSQIINTASVNMTINGEGFDPYVQGVMNNTSHYYYYYYYHHHQQQQTHTHTHIYTHTDTMHPETTLNSQHPRNVIETFK